MFQSTEWHQEGLVGFDIECWHGRFETVDIQAEYKAAGQKWRH